MLKGPGLWKFNCSLLSKKAFAQEMTTHLNELLDSTEHIEDRSLRWEAIKNSIIEFSQWFSRREAKQKKEKKSALTKRLCSLEKKLPMLNLKSPSVLR